MNEDTVNKLLDRIDTAMIGNGLYPECLDCRFADNCPVVIEYDARIEQLKKESYLRKYPYLEYSESQALHLVKTRIGRAIGEALNMHTGYTPRAIMHDFSTGKGYRILDDIGRGKTFALSATAFSWENTGWLYITSYDLIEALEIRQFSNYSEVSTQDRYDNLIPKLLPEEKGNRIVLLDDVNQGILEKEYRTLARYIDYLERSKVIICVVSNMDKFQVNDLTKQSNEASRFWIRVKRMTDKIEKE